MQAFKLYELSDQYIRVADMMEHIEDADTLRDTLDSLDDAFEAKVESIVKLWRSKVAERDAIKAERYRLEQREKSLDKQADWLKRYVETHMRNMGKSEVKSSLFSIRLQNNPVAVEVLDETIVPEQYTKLHIERKLDKPAIKAAIESGEEVPGVELRQGQSLHIR